MSDSNPNDLRERFNQRMANTDAQVGDFMAGNGGLAATAMIVLFVLFFVIAVIKSLLF